MEVSAEEYMNWGRTRLRVELKKRGLSPSGLKTELLARLEEYFKRQRASGGGGAASNHQSTNHAHHHNNNNNNNNRSSAPATSSSSSATPSSAPAGPGQPHLLPKQHHAKQLLDLFHQHNQQQQQQQHMSEAAALGAVPRKRPRKSQTPRRGLQPQGSADNTSSEGEGSDHSGSSGSPRSSSSSPPLYGDLSNNHYNNLGNDFPSSSALHTNKKPRLGQHHQHESDDNSEAVPAGDGHHLATPLSGRVFKKESGQVQAPHAEVRSVETIVFGPGDRFHFTHRFWRGKLLRRRFDFYGSYSIVPATSAGGSPSVGEGLHLEDLAALSCAFAAEGEKGGAAEESRLKELTEGKVILHWPSKLDAPELRDWQFDKSYSHLFLAAAASSSSPTGGGLGSSSDAASLLQPGSTSPLLGAGTSGPAAADAGVSQKRPHFLYTKHSAVFVEDTC